MKVGLTLPQAGVQATRENVLNMAKMAENEGLDSVWVFERLLWPINPQTPYVATPDGSLPTEYQNMLDPLETLTFVSANTTKISLGTSVIDSLFHNPVILARQFASLDIFSQGRVIAGLGIGWSKDEYQASNIPFTNKGKRANEFVQLLKKIWTEEEIEYKGTFYDLPKSKIGPKPLQKPHIPTYLGGFSNNTFKRIVENDLNGWLGIIGGVIPFDYVKNTINNLKNEISKAQKSIDNFKVILLAYPSLVSSYHSDVTDRPILTGTVEQIGNDIRRIKELGVEHIIFGHNFSPFGKNVDKMIDITKQFSKFAR